MNLLKLRAQVRSKLGLDSAVVANSAIDERLNIAQYLIASKLSTINEDFFEQQKTKGNLTQNSSLYSLPTDFLKFKQLRLAYSTPSSEGDYKIATSYDPTQIDDVASQEENVTTTNPIVDITNKSFRIKPNPTSAVTNGYELYWIARPSALTNTGDIPTFPIDYHDLLSDYATYDLSAAFELWEKYKVYKGEWEQGVREMLKDVAPRNINNSQRMRNITEKSVRKSVTELWG